MKRKNFLIIVFTLMFFVGVLSVFPAEKQTSKTVKGETIPNLGGKMAIEPASGSYVSPLTFDYNQSHHETVFEHNLGVVPKNVTIYFTHNRVDYFPLMQRWTGLSYGPVTIKVTSSHIILEIVKEAFIFAAWNANNSTWTTWNEGYWVVVASK